MSFTRFRIAAVGAALLAVMLSHAAAQQAAPTPPAVIRFPAGAAFEVPQSWSWGELVTSGGVDTVELTYDATGSNDRTKNNPNRLTVQLGMTPSEESWSRIDINQSQTLPNGVSARWKSGARWNIHSWFEGWATAGSKTIRVLASGGLPAKFNSGVLQAAFLKIAGSMREVPEANLLFHPVWRWAIDRPDPKRWLIESASGNSFDFRCAMSLCGQGNKTQILVWRVPRGSYDDLGTDLTTELQPLARHNNFQVGEIRREAMAGGEIAWTEQPGSTYPFCGAVRRGDDYFFVFMSASQKMTASNDDLRNDYLAAARSVRAWDGR